VVGGTTSPSDIRTYYASTIDFVATVGEEPEIEIGLV
jgi:hypothetical protein